MCFKSKSKDPATKPFDLEKAYKRTGIVANIIIIIQVFSVIIALYSFYNTNNFNKRQIIVAESSEKTKNAIEAINKIYNTEFLRNYDKIDSTSTIKDEETRISYYHVLNTYYILSVVYNSKIADSLMMYKAIKDGIMAFAQYDIYIDSSQKNLMPAKEEINKMLKSFKELNLNP